MRGSRLFDHTDWKSKKDLHVFRFFVITENIGIVKSKKKKVYTSLDVLFSAESIGKEKKRFSLFVMIPPFSTRP